MACMNAGDSKWNTHFHKNKINIEAFETTKKKQINIIVGNKHETSAQF